MRIHLVQHGKATSKDENPDRPLTEEGREDVQRVGARLAAGDVRVSRIVHSGKTRARQTAEQLAELLEVEGRRPPVDRSDDLGPTDDTSVWADRLDDDEHDGVVLVGHLPFMERMAARLVSGDPEHDVVTFSKGGVLRLERDDGWTVRWFVTPAVA